MHTLKNADLSFADDLVNLWRSTFKDAYGKTHAPDDLDAYCAENYTHSEAEKILGADEYDCVIAYSPNGAAGYSIIKWASCPLPLDGASAELKQIYIRADAYGAGLGKQLFNDSIIKLKNKQFVWMWLAVADNNKRAQGFYAKNGFTRQGRGPNFHVGKDILTSSILARRIEG